MVTSGVVYSVADWIAQGVFHVTNTRMMRISFLENMLSISSNSLVSMVSQLSEAKYVSVPSITVEGGTSCVLWEMQRAYFNICSILSPMQGAKYGREGSKRRR